MLRSVLLLVLFSASTCHAELPKLYTQKNFTCATLAEAVNYYVGLGEEEAAKQLEAHSIDWLKEDYSDISRNERVGFVCRILYQPKGDEPLRAPRYGGHDLPWNTMPLERWSLYPMAAAGDSYFALAEGYSLLGVAENPFKYLKYCRDNGSFRKKPVPVPTRAQALKDAQALRNSAAWKAIKWEDKGQGFYYIMDEQPTWMFIEAQAENLPALVDLGGPAVVAFNRDAKGFAVGAGKQLSLYDSTSLKVVRELTGHKRQIHAVAFSPDGKLLASGDGGIIEDHLAGEIKVWDVATGKPLRSLSLPDSGVATMSISPNGKWIVGGGAKGFRVWDLQSGEIAHEQDIVGGALAVAFSPDSGTLAHCGFDEVVTLRSTETWEAGKVLKRHRTELHALAFSPKGEVLASGGGGELKLWDTSSGDLLRTIKRGSTVWSAAFTPDGKYVVTGGGDSSESNPDGTIRTDLELSEFDTDERWTADNQGINSISISRDGKWILSGGNAGTVELRKLMTWR